MKLKFAHLADLHLGAWRDKTLQSLNFKTFHLAISQVIKEKVDFCLFAGDIFNHALPSIELVEMVVKELKKLKENNIPLYVIGGSHDYSITGKSYLNLLHTLEVFEDVAKFEIVDEGVINLKFTQNSDLKLNLSGVLGKKNGLDKNIYQNLSSDNLSQDNFNIFMFHTTLGDFKPDFMKQVKIEVDSSFLPKGFDYYAGGHVHTPILGEVYGSKMSYPGALFPNNFKELKREECGFNLCEFDFDTREVKVDRIDLKTYEKEILEIFLDNLNPVEAKVLIEEKLLELDVEGKIILVEISGIINGKIGDIGVSNIISNLYDRGALVVLKNLYKLNSSDFDKVNFDIYDDNLNIEKEIIESNLEEKIDIDNFYKLLKIDFRKDSEEKNLEFEKRVIDCFDNEFFNKK